MLAAPPKNRRRPTLPGAYAPSTIGAGGLNFRVRNGNGWFPAANATGNPSCSAPRALHSEHARLDSSSPRPISTGQLNALLRFHVRPINLVFYQGPYPRTVGGLILEPASHLDAFSAYPCRT